MQSNVRDVTDISLIHWQPFTPHEIHTVTEHRSLHCDSKNCAPYFVPQLWQNTECYRTTDTDFEFSQLRDWGGLLSNDYLVVALQVCQHWRLYSNMTTCMWEFRFPQQCCYRFRSSVMLHCVTVSQCFKASCTFIFKRFRFVGLLNPWRWRHHAPLKRQETPSNRDAL